MKPTAAVGRHLRLVRDEPGAGPAPPEVDDDLDIDS